MSTYTNNPQDPYKGDDLSNMAPTGTTMPNDAGLQNTLPSYPRPSQTAESAQFDNEGIAEPSLAFAADNAKDLPRSTKDEGLSGEVITGTGNEMPSEVEAKRVQRGSKHPGAKGRTRDGNFVVKKGSVYDTTAKEDGNAGEFVGEHEGRNRV